MTANWGISATLLERPKSEGESRGPGKTGQYRRAGIENRAATKLLAASVKNHCPGPGTAAENADQPRPVLELA
jgi:hypothetical protein